MKESHLAAVGTLQSVPLDQTNGARTNERPCDCSEEVQTALDAAKTEFLELAAHELRTPITSFKGGLLLLLKHWRELPEDTMDTLLDVLDRSFQRLETSALDLLAAAELNAVRREGTTPALGTETLTAFEVVSERVRAFPTNGHRIAVTADDRAIRVKADREALSQVLDRLLDNATKFTEESSAILIHLRQTDGHALISVRDEGPGIPREDRQRIFDSFVTLGDTTTREEHGLGLGLFIVRTLVDVMGGSVWVEGGFGGGATFNVALPLANNGHRPRRL